MFRYPLVILIICIISVFPQLDAFLVLSTTSTGSITSLRSKIHPKQHSTTNSLLRSAPLTSVLLSIRGGSSDEIIPKSATETTTATTSKTTMTTTIFPTALTSFIPLSLVGTWLPNTLQHGPLGVIGLTFISSMIVVPITQYKNMYGVSVGYGLSVAAIAAVLRNIFVISPFSINDVISGAALFYGLRLATFLFIRDVSGAKSLNATKKSPRLQRIPFALSLALFYAFMMTPMLYMMRNPIIITSNLTWKSCVAWTGCGLAWLGAVAEAIADTHKYIVKGRSNHSAVAFRGPTHGLYGITRHPNYTGEVIYWVGIFIAGLPAFGNSIIAWLCSTAGLYGIVTIMRGATKSLEKKQEEKYSGQPKYERWKKDVPVALFPFL
jgi:steroid 5-alpha reductase family enzyme